MVIISQCPSLINHIGCIPSALPRRLVAQEDVKGHNAMELKCTQAEKNRQIEAIFFYVISKQACKL